MLINIIISEYFKIYADTVYLIDYLSRYEMLLFMDPLANSLTPWQKNDFEMAFRMVKPTDIFSLAKDNSDDGESTDYTNSDTDQEFYN